MTFACNPDPSCGQAALFDDQPVTALTEYVILELDSGLNAEAGQWRERGRSSGTSAESAIRAVIKDEGTYVGNRTRGTT